MPSIEELNLEKEALLKQRKLRDERFEEQLNQAISENKDRYNPNTYRANVLSDAEIQEMRKKHEEEMQKEFGEKIESIDKEAVKVLEENIQKETAEIESIKKQIAENEREIDDVKQELKDVEAEYNHAVTMAFHGENSSGSIDTTELTSKKEELESRMNSLTVQREGLLRELNSHEINAKTYENELNIRMKDMPEEKAKPGTYDKDGSYVMTKREEESWKEWAREDDNDEDSIDKILQRERWNKYANEGYNFDPVDEEKADTKVEYSEEEKASVNRIMDEMQKEKARRIREENNLEDGKEKMCSDVVIKNGKLFLDLYWGQKEFKMLLNERDEENTSIDNTIKSFCEGENAMFTPLELTELLASELCDKNKIKAENKDEIFNYARDLNQIDKNIVANIVNYYKGIEQIANDSKKVQAEIAIRNYLSTVRGESSKTSIDIDIKNKNGWDITNKGLTNYEIIKNWAYTNKNRDGFRVKADRKTKLSWRWKDLVRKFKGNKEALPEGREQHKRLSDLSEVVDGEYTVLEPKKEQDIDKKEEKFNWLASLRIQANESKEESAVKKEEYYDNLLKQNKKDKENAVKNEEYYDNLLKQNKKDKDDDIDM